MAFGVQGLGAWTIYRYIYIHIYIYVCVCVEPLRTSVGWQGVSMGACLFNLFAFRPGPSQNKLFQCCTKPLNPKPQGPPRLDTKPLAPPNLKAPRIHGTIRLSLSCVSNSTSIHMCYIYIYICVCVCLFICFYIFICTYLY